MIQFWESIFSVIFESHKRINTRILLRHRDISLILFSCPPVVFGSSKNELPSKVMNRAAVSSFLYKGGGGGRKGNQPYSYSIFFYSLVSTSFDSFYRLLNVSLSHFRLFLHCIRQEVYFIAFSISAVHYHPPSHNSYVIWQARCKLVYMIQQGWCAMS